MTYVGKWYLWVPSDGFSGALRAFFIWLCQIWDMCLENGLP